MEKETIFQFNRVGYYSNVNRMSIQYANGSKNRPADFSYDKLVDMNAMQTFLNASNATLTEEMNQEFGNIFESVDYRIKVISDDSHYRGGLDPHLEIIAKEVLSIDKIKQCQDYLDTYQKTFAKNFNKQPFTETEYGFAKFPKSNKFGIHIIEDDKLIPDLRVSVTGKKDDKYKEIVAFPSLLGDCTYIFKFDEDKWPKVKESLYYTKNGEMRTSEEPIMSSVRDILEEMGQFESVEDITIYSSNAVCITIPSLDDDTIFSIANNLGDYGLEAKRQEDGEELQRALDTVQTLQSKMNNMEI